LSLYQEGTTVPVLSLDNIETYQQNFNFASQNKMFTETRDVIYASDDAGGIRFYYRNCRIHAEKKQGVGACG